MMDLPPGMDEETFRNLFERYFRPKGGGNYDVLARVPGAKWGHTIEVGFNHIWEARGYIANVAGSYPNGTLLYIVHGTWNKKTLKETFQVIEGEAVRRPRRGWIPYEGTSIEDVNLEDFPSIGEAAEALRRGYVSKSRLESLKRGSVEEEEEEEE